MNDGLIRMYRENSRQTGEFILKKCDSFSLLGKIVNELYFVFEAKSSHQVYAIKRTMTTNQRDSEQIDEDVDEEIQPIRNQESESLSSFASFSPSPTPNGVSTDETVDDAILWHNRLTHRAISTLQKVGIVPKSVQIDPHWYKSYVEGKQMKLPYRPPVSQEEYQLQQQVSPESREQEPMQEIVVQNGPPPEENHPHPHESNIAQSKPPVNDNPSFEEAPCRSRCGNMETCHVKGVTGYRTK